MDAAAQVQPEIHGQGADGAQPGRRGRREMQRHHVALSQPPREKVARAQLRLRVRQAHQDALALERHRPVGQPRLLQRPLDLLAHVLAHEPARGRDLQRRVLAVEVRQGVDDADRQRRQQQQVLPERVAVHGPPRAQESDLRLPLGRRPVTAIFWSLTSTPSAISSVT